MVTTDTNVLLPDQGREIRYRHKGKEWRVGIVRLVWAYEEAVIDLEGGDSLIPAFGDEWAYNATT